MNQPSPAIRASAFLVITITALGLAISNESFWIDEAYAASKAILPNIGDWAKAMREQAGSDLQMPFYMFFLWLWQKLGGSNEWYLRMGNAPWFLLGFLPFCWNRWALAVVTATSGFVWYYLNEARPYTMQIAGALLLFAGCRGLFPRESDRPAELRAPVAVALGLALLSGSSLLGMIWAGAAVLAIGIAVPFSRVLSEFKTHRMLWVVTALLLTFLAGYYLWTLKQGARASASAITELRNVVYALYELMGFNGLGPGPLAVYAGLATAVAIAGIRALVRSASSRVLLTIAMVSMAASIFLFLTGYQLHFRVLARHLAPVVVVWLLISAAGVEALWSRGRLGRAIVIIFILLSSISCLELRFAPRHAKDDYRGAAAIAKRAAASGNTLWWNADANGAAYYGAVGFDRIAFLMNPSAEYLRATPEPQVVIVSKPELYDNAGAVAAYLRDHQYRRVSTVPAFTIWEKSP
jgi:hypothetical protein